MAEREQDIVCRPPARFQAVQYALAHYVGWSTFAHTTGKIKSKVNTYHSRGFVKLQVTTEIFCGVRLLARTWQHQR